MTTAQLSGTGGSLPHEVAPVRVFSAARATTGPVVIAAGLLVIVLYAAFAHGAVALGDGTRVEVAVAAVAAAAAGTWLWKPALSLRAPSRALAGLGLLALFAAWNGISLLWSVAPDQTWIELNRVIAYVTVLAVAMALGKSGARLVELTGHGYLAIGILVSAYALGQKLLPGIHIGHLITLNQNGPLPRLQEPLGYWNALALFIALAVPLAVAVASDTARATAARLVCLCVASLMLLTIAFTYSRGGLIALAVAVVVGMAASGQRLRWLMWLAVVLLGATPALAVGLSSGPLTTASVPLGRREGAGGVLLAVVVVSLLLLCLAARWLMAREPALRIAPVPAPRLRRLGALVSLVAVVGILLGLTFSSRGLTGTVSHAWHTFTATKAISNYNPRRLLSADSQYRWVWWKEAAGAFSDRPVAGWGAGSFGVVHLLYRDNTLSVQQPHSVPLQFLSDTGIVGALLAIGGVALLFAAAVAAVRRSLGPERLVAAALLGGAAAYAVHSFYDWDWDIPGVTLPALLFLGLLAGWGGRMSDAERGRVLPERRLGWRTLALGAATVWLCLYGLSSELPALASADASTAVIRAAGSSPGALAAAQSSASLAARLDPLSDAGPLAEETVALHRGRWLAARRYVLEALRREPSDETAWGRLAQVDTLLRDRPEMVRAAQRIVTLDPRGAVARYELETQLLAASPAASATAIRTPPLGR